MSSNSSNFNAWLGFFLWVGLSIFALILTLGFEGEIANYRYGPGGWPRGVFISIIIIATLKLFFDIRQTKKVGSTTIDQEYSGLNLFKHFGGLPITTIAVPVVYTLLIMPFGFFVTTPFFLAGVMLMMGERRWKHILAITMLIFGLIIIVFIKFLYVPLPMGTVQLSYDISNFFLVNIR
jgi:hypothetical protein|tara:strand:- start:1948 stop:2484 length:537 start_codon:yes stop_codon:yes gene_type:complete